MASAGRGILDCFSVGFQPSRRSLLAAWVDALFDVAHGLQIFIEFVPIAGAHARLQRMGFGEHGIEDAAVELAAFAVTDQLVEGARGINFFGGGFGRRDPGDR